MRDRGVVVSSADGVRRTRVRLSAVPYRFSTCSTLGRSSPRDRRIRFLVSCCRTTRFSTPVRRERVSCKSPLERPEREPDCSPACQATDDVRRALEDRTIRTNGGHATDGTQRGHCTRSAGHPKRDRELRVRRRPTYRPIRSLLDPLPRWSSHPSNLPSTEWYVNTHLKDWVERSVHTDTNREIGGERWPPRRVCRVRDREFRRLQPARDGSGRSNRRS